MDPQSKSRLFGFRDAFDDPFVVWVCLAVVGLLCLGYLLTLVLGAAGVLGGERKAELIKRLHSWAVLIPMIGLPILMGAFWTMLAMFALSVFCYREFARVTGQFRNYTVSSWTVFGMLFIYFAVLDHWYNLFQALPGLGVAVISAAAVISDRPKGYLQRTALAVMAFLWFGVSFGHIAYIANDIDYRAILLLLFVTVELNDVFAYLCGNLFGRNKLCRNTSPNKTLEGSLGAIVCTTVLVYFLGGIVFDGTPIDTPLRLIGLGIVVSVTGQLGDLVMSSVKRDLEIKDTGTILPGHGGLLDRFDSLMLIGPAFFHYVGYFNKFGLDQTTHIFTGP